MENKKNINVLVAGDSDYADVYTNFFIQNGLNVVRYNSNMTFGGGLNVHIAVIFSKFGLYGVLDILEEFNKKGFASPVLPVMPSKDFNVLDNMFKREVDDMAFDLEPEKLLNDIYERLDSKKIVGPPVFETGQKSDYTINFFEKKGTFFVDVGGSLDKAKLTGLRIMFKDYLKNKVQSLRGIVYIFNNINELSIQFQTIWSLFRIWKDIGIDFHKVFYLTASDSVAGEINEYTDHLGVHRYSNLFHIVQKLYPELKGKGENVLFDFASDLIQLR